MEIYLKSIYVTDTACVSILSSFCTIAVVAAELFITCQNTCQVVCTCEHNQNNFVLNTQAEESCDK